MDRRNLLWYRREGKNWMEALPLGNGRIGAMLYGGPLDEKIQVDETTFWSGCPAEDNDIPGTWERTKAIREALQNEEYEKADLLGKDFVGKKGNYGTNLPVGNLVISMKGLDPEKVTEYERYLDIRDSVGGVRFSCEGARFHRELFVSNPAQVLVLRLKQEAEEKKTFSLTIGYEKIGAPVGLSGWEGRDFLIFGDARETLHSDGKTGVHLDGRIRVLTDGETAFRDGKIQVEKATEYTLLLDLHTDMEEKKKTAFVKEEVQDGNTISGQESEQQSTPSVICRKELDAAEEKGFERLLAEHVADVRRLFDRVDLTLGAEDRSDIPTDERIAFQKAGEDDQDLMALFFRYGRYLLLASSRENSPLPTHMGGIWNDNIYCNMGCAQDMHIDMNIQMQYWLSAQCNLKEAYWSLFPWVKDTLVPNGRKTAKLAYDARGFAAHVVANPWGFTALGWEYNWGAWALGGVWTATLLWDYYQYTSDEKFLKDYAYPIIREAAEFASDYLFWDEKQGLYMAGPSYSPENHYMVDGKEYTLGISNTCDIVLIREILTIAVKAERVLGIYEDSDNQNYGKASGIWPGLTSEFSEKLSKLPPYKIGKDGRIQEWFYDFEEPDLHHRHTSHLLGLYPFRQITPEQTPKLKGAAEKSIEVRYEDYEITSWGMAMYLGYNARMRNTENAKNGIRTVFRELVKPSLIAVMGDENDIWQGTWELDGNTGMTAAMGELLIQSDGDDIYVLPALPADWTEGCLTGISLHGARTADITWAEGRLEHITIHPEKDGRAVVHYKDTSAEVTLKAGEPVTLDGQLR